MWDYTEPRIHFWHTQWSAIHEQWSMIKSQALLDFVIHKPPVSSGMTRPEIKKILSMWIEQRYHQEIAVIKKSGTSYGLTFTPDLCFKSMSVW